MTSSTNTGSPSSVEGGLLSIRLIEARLALPEGVELSVGGGGSHHGTSASIGAAGSVGVNGMSMRKRESLQRREMSCVCVVRPNDEGADQTACRHLPYIIITFDRNDVVIDPLGTTS